MHVLSQEEFELVAEPLLYQVFVGNNYTEPFQPQVEERLFLYFPCGDDLERNNYWEKQLYEAIAHAASQIDDRGCYLVSSWQGTLPVTIFDGSIANGSPMNRAGYINQSEIAEEFGNLTVWSQLNISNTFDFCLCSESGKWGLLKRIYDHAFLGGTGEFMQAVKSYFPEIEQEIHEYLSDARIDQMYGDNISITWLKQALTHVYGAEVAEEMLIKSQLDLT
jgi:hypothetical protein